MRSNLHWTAYRRRALPLIGAFSLGLPAAPAQAAVTFPPALDVRTLSAWLVQETEIRPEQVVAVSRASVAAIVAGPEQRDGYQRVTVRSEAVDPSALADEPLLSSQLDVAVDCAGRRTRQGATTGHTQRNLAGTGRIVAAQEPDWRTPSPGTQLENVWRAVCDPGFQRPLLARAPASQKQDVALTPPKPKPMPKPMRTPTPRTPTLKVQVGAYPSAAEARASASQLRTQFPDMLRNRKTEVSPGEVAGKTYYRLLISGFASAPEQGAFCARLKTAGRDCFVRKASATGGPAPRPASATTRPSPAKPEL